MPKEENNINPGGDYINPTIIAQIASRMYNEFPESSSIPKNESDVMNIPSSLQDSAEWKSSNLQEQLLSKTDYQSNNDQAIVEQFKNHESKIHTSENKKNTFQNESFLKQEFTNQSRLLELQNSSGNFQYPDNYFLSGIKKDDQEPLGNHADNLVNQQSYSSNKDGSYGLNQFINKSQPPKLGLTEGFDKHSKENDAPFFKTISSGLPTDDIIDISFLYSNVQSLVNPDTNKLHANPEKYIADAGIEEKNHNQPHLYSGDIQQDQQPFFDGKCFAQQIYDEISIKLDNINIEGIPQSLKSNVESLDFKSGIFPDKLESITNKLPNVFSFDLNNLKGTSGFNTDTISGGIDNITTGDFYRSYYFIKEPNSTISKPDIFNVATIRKDFPVLNQKVHGKQLIWFDNAATTQKPISVINAVSSFYAKDNSNIHRGSHTLAARATDAYENARDTIRKFIGAGSTSEIVFVRGTTEGINLVAQTFGRKFIDHGDEIIVTVLDHHANIVPWQMLAKEKGAILRVAPVNDKGEILLDEYTKLFRSRTKFVALPHANNSIGTILPVKEMIDIAHKYGAHVLIDGAQSVAHIPVNVQNLGADFFVFSGHKIFAPTGIGVLYARRELLELMPPWQGGGNMIQNVSFEETTFSEPPAKFEAGTPNVADAVGLGAALDYVSKIGLVDIARYEHELTEYATKELHRVPDLMIIGQAREKVAVLSFVLRNVPTEEVGKLLDREGIAVRAGHHCAQPSLRRFGLSATVRPSLSFYNTRDEVDKLIAELFKISKRK